MAKKEQENSSQPLRVAVIGAGIAGMGAAWSLHRAGHHVEVYETNAHIGGNARTHTWNSEGQEVVTGLSVLAWPDTYFRNYNKLIESFGLQTEKAKIKFLIKVGDDIIAHGLDTGGRQKFASDFLCWQKLIEHVRRINRLFALSSVVSFYHTSPANPLSLLPLRKLARMYGVSDSFWDHVVVPIYSSSFLTTDLSTVPAVILPILDDIIGIEAGSTLTTWAQTSAQVFEHLSQGFADRIYTECPITNIELTNGKLTIRDRTHRLAVFDRVIFACNAQAALQALPNPSWQERQLLSSVQYTEDTDESFLQASVHSDASVLPEQYRDTLLKEYANYIEVITESDGRLRYENTFIVSSWAPTARNATLPMLVSYNTHKPIATIDKQFSNRRAHPALSAKNLLIAYALRRIQGRRGIYYCSSYTTPGNGHDLSLLSGLAVAAALGAPYPFAEDAAARQDFEHLYRWMFGRRKLNIATKEALG